VPRANRATRGPQFAVREPAGLVSALAGLPELVIGGLDEGAAMELLASLLPGRLSPAVAALIIAETGGNPLALAEVARELSPGQLAGSEALPEPLPGRGSSDAQPCGGPPGAPCCPSRKEAPWV